MILIPFSFQSVGSAASGSFGIAWLAATDKLYSFLLGAWLLAARNQCFFAQLKPNGRVTWKFICRIGHYSARRAESLLLKAVTLVGKTLLLATLGFQITTNSSRDILKWAFAARILRPFQTTAHAGVLRYAP